MNTACTRHRGQVTNFVAVAIGTHLSATKMLRTMPLKRTLATTMRTVAARHAPRRLISSSPVARRSDDDEDANPFARPAPPPLPPKEQREFEQLVREKASE